MNSPIAPHIFTLTGNLLAERTLTFPTWSAGKTQRATGSGDVFFACVLEAIYRRRMSLPEAVSFALPYAAANAAHPGVAEFPEPVA